ncbi:MAG: AMP-binding protein, partial [bacterium]|nr:AMP-binding protein [bacterium]
VTGKKALNIGKPIANTTIYIIDRWGKLQPKGIAGELCIGGDGLARGYLNKPELTAEKFVGAFIKTGRDGLSSEKGLATGGHTRHRPPEATLYKTGDLARWLADGNIEFLGRIDHQVKIRGFRIELGEIENRLLSHPEINEVVVLDRQSEDGDNFLCAYYVVEKIRQPASGIQPPESTPKHFLSQYLPDYMIPSFFIKLEQIPLTINGKIDRKALSQYPTSNIQHQTRIAPRNEKEEKLSGIWADILGVQKQKIGIDDNFFDIGGHSLRATILVSQIHKEFDVKLPLAVIFKKSSIRTLAGTITEFTRQTSDKYIAIKPAEKKEYYLLSSAQKRQFVLQQIEPESTAYNMPCTIPLPKDTDPVKLRDVFKKLIRRHESLRTSFHMLPVTSGGDPVTPGGVSPVTPGEVNPFQKIHNNVEFEIEYYKPGAGNQGAETGEIKNPKNMSIEFFRPFELSKAPLLRVGIIETTAGKTIHDGFMMLDMHHIITDGTSQKVLLNDFLTIHAEKSLPTLKLQYKDYAEWQNSREQKELVKQQEQYWKDRLSGELPVLNLPTDYHRPVNQSFEGNNIAFELNNKETGNLKAAAKENETTLYMTILSIFTILLSKLSGQQDIIVGTPTAGRNHAELENIIGMFVNTLAMRNYPHGEITIEEYLRELKENTLQAFENRDYPFEDLVDRLSVKRDTGRNPIFDVMFDLLNQTEYKEQNNSN